MDAALLRRLMEQFIPFNEHLGIRLCEVDRGRVRMEIAFRPELVGDASRGALHGGVISALADTCGGAALLSATEDDRMRVSTIDLRIDYLRPGKQETLAAEGTVVRLGKRVGVADMRMFHPSAPTDTVATGKGVYNVVLPKEKK
jgi:uncharacterized protein (TIGR00369 family)